MCLLPFSLLPQPFFSLYLAFPSSPLLLPQSFCLSCFSLSFSLSELARCANVSTLPFICQSPEQRPAPSVYLCLHSAAPSALLFSSSPPHPHPTPFSLLKTPSFPPPYVLFIPSSPPHSPHFHPPHPFLRLCCIPPLHISPSAIPLPFFTPFLLHPSTHPAPAPLPSRSWIMALHWSNIMTFPVLSTTSASSFFGLNPLHHHLHHPPPRRCFALHLF